METLAPKASSTCHPRSCLIGLTLHLAINDGEIKEYVALESNNIERGVPQIAPIVSTTIY